MKKNWSISQILLLGSICVTIAAVFSTIVMTNITLRPVKKNLPETLIKELNSIKIVFTQLSDTVAAAEVFANDTSDSHLNDLKKKIRISAQSIDGLHDGFVYDNLVQASTLHGIAAPIISDLQIWLNEAVPGSDPKTNETARIVMMRVSGAFEKVQTLYEKSHLNVRNQFREEQARLDRFLTGVNYLFMLTLLISIFMIFLFIRQHFSRIREIKAEQTLTFQKDLLNSLFEGISIGIMVWGKKGTLLFANAYFTRLTGFRVDEINNIEDWLVKFVPETELRDVLQKEWSMIGSQEESVREVDISCKDGAVITVELRPTILSDKRFLVTLTDITERKKGEAHLHHFKTAVELSSDAIGMSNPKGQHWYQNRAFDSLFGDVGTDPPASLYVDEAVGRDVFKTIMAGRQWIGEVEMYARDKTILSVLLRAYAIKDENGKILGLVGTHTDMTQQKQAEKALYQSEEKYRVVVENTPDLMYRTDMEGAITFVSSSVEQTSGYTVDEAMGMKMAEEVYVYPEERQGFLEQLAAQGSVRNFEARLKRKDGSIWWASTNAHFYKDADGNIAGVEGVTRDITETKKAQADLKASEERFKIAGMASYDLIYEWDVKTDSLEWFGDIDTFLGFDKGDISNNISAWLNLIHPDDRPKLEGAVEMHRTATTPINYEYRIRLKDGAWRYWKDNALPLIGEDGLPFKWIGICADITRRKESEQALLKSEQKMRAILDANPDPMVMYDIRGFPQFINPAFTKVFGWTLDELEGGHIPFVPSDQKERSLAKIKEIYANGRPLSFETRRRTKDRLMLDIFLSAAVVKTKEGDPTGLVVNLTDISQQKALEAQSEHIQKMESIGTLAGGIAHDFNNLLSGIFGYLDLARKKTTEPKISQYLEKAFKASERAKGLTHQLLTFSKGGAPVKNIEPLVPFLQDTCQFALSGANVSCTFDIPDDLWMCNYDKNQIGQVIDNIIINAHHAMPSGGNIHVAAVNVILAANEHPGRPSGRLIKISISDTGTGIQEKYLSRIFDPFFTTKQQGSGLGLATSYSIVKRHGGIIDVDSELDLGSCFYIYLPAAEETGDIQKTEEKDVYLGTGKILVMDDEEMIQEMLTDMLEPMGFSVVCTDDGRSAVQIVSDAASREKPFRAVILDLTVRGGMGGKEAVREIRKKDKKTPVFLASGYSKDDAIANPEAYGFTASLQKPFSIENIVQIFTKHL